jgi:hypothetical protein
MSETETSAPDTANDEIIARPDIRYRGKHLAMALASIIFGLWFAYDGYIGWPKHNVEVRNVKKAIGDAEAKNDAEAARQAKAKLGSMRAEYTETDILIQKLLAYTLPVAGLLYGIWTLIATRGQLHLQGKLLRIPGAGSIPFEDIRRIDKRRWDRKGIALVHYETHHPRRTRIFKLDDFAYARKPTGEILARIEEHLAPPTAMPAPESESAAPESEPAAPEQ